MNFDLNLKVLPLKPFSVTNNSVGSRTAAASHMDHNSSAHIVHRGHSQTGAETFKVPINNPMDVY